MLGVPFKQFVTKVNPIFLGLLSIGTCAVGFAVVSQWYQIDIWISPLTTDSRIPSKVGTLTEKDTNQLEQLDSPDALPIEEQPKLDMGKWYTEDRQSTPFPTTPSDRRGNNQRSRESWLSFVPPHQSPPSNITAPLRLSNQTEHPLRVAILPRRFSNLSSPPLSSHAPVNSEPFHWDFAPEEGSIKGLVLSLPDGDFILQGGDIVIAFAQDGSRRYWGPFVIGETTMPGWNQKKSEWVLIIQ